ncbi:regulatory protein, luxR family [Solimonas aquatica]|uniref:Regulatory protein, luxR family n=1 Tax=Solimonas aquatica TaxID=489703 RepID=A0A1H9LJS3_9GAMM|nr:LuxR family transcriptional regulator [Solimonas aquatica]SER11741.1 regulatory protein, luxR family [Solimonas aquatica]
MSVPTQSDAIDPVDRLIVRLYRTGILTPAEQFRSWALAQLARLIPCDGAIWGSGSVAPLKFHTVTVHGLPSEFPQRLQDSTPLNPIVPRLMQSLDTPVDMADVMDDAQFFASELYRDTFAPYGIERILATGHLDRRSGLYSLLTLYRKDRGQRFTEQERARQKRAVYHLFNAASHTFFVHVASTHRERPPGSAAAVVDGAGVFHEAQLRFLDLLDERVPERDPQRLPFELPPPGETRGFGDLMLRSEAYGDLFLVILWPAGPLDRLTAREREVVFCVAQGLSFKQAAKKIGVAPSTVANHLYRVYRKLGVCSRTELAGLVHPQQMPGDS